MVKDGVMDHGGGRRDAELSVGAVQRLPLALRFGRRFLLQFGQTPSLLLDHLLT